MADTAPGPEMPIEQKHSRWRKFKIFAGMEPHPSGMPPFIWVERWNAFIVAAIVAIGVPLLGLSGFSHETKKTILIFWFATWSVFFAYFEGREMVGQMIGRGAIKQEQLSEQQNTAQNPFFGVIIAFFIWLVVLAIHVALTISPVADASMMRFIFVQIPVGLYRGYSTTPLYYGIVEWSILIHVWIVTSLFNYIMYNIGNTFSKAAPMGERVSLNRI